MVILGTIMYGQTRLAPLTAGFTVGQLTTYRTPCAANLVMRYSTGMCVSTTGGRAAPGQKIHRNHLREHTAKPND